MGPLPIPTWHDLIDIAVVASLAWLAIQTLRRTRARAALGGLALVAGVYFLARTAGLELTTALLQSFFAVVVLVIVVLFQEDLRRAFEQLGSLRAPGGGPSLPGQDRLDALVRSVARLASNRTGALIVIPGRESLERHIEGGIALNGRLSEPLLLSLFDTSSPGHDGAVLLRGGTVERFAVHLPLSVNHAALGPGGTRHAAALGLSERCDATCIVVSEERGTVSLARNGQIRVLERPEDLLPELRAPAPATTTVAGITLRRRWLDGAIALGGALVLWMVFVPGSDVDEARLDARIEVTNLPADLALESVDPDVAVVTLRGLRRDLLLADESDVTVRVDAYLARLGRRTFSLSDAEVRKPDELSVVGVVPEKVRLSLRPAKPAERPAGGAPSP